MEYAHEQPETGERRQPWGSSLAGLLVYGADGFMSVQMMSTEPRAAADPASGAETMVVSDDLEVDAETEDAFAFEASDDLHDPLPTSSSFGGDVDAPAETMQPPAEPEMAPDSTVAILPEDDAFESALTEPPEAPATLGESDLTWCAWPIPSTSLTTRGLTSLMYRSRASFSSHVWIWKLIVSMLGGRGGGGGAGVGSGGVWRRTRRKDSAPS